MPTFIAGLPMHVLVVHAVVVLVPLAVLAAIAVAVWPAARRRYGWLTVGITALATAAIPVATDTGGLLRERLPDNPLIRQHAALGDELLIAMAPLLVLVIAIMLLEHYPSFARRRAGTHRADGPGAALTAPSLRWARPLSVVLAALTTVVAVFAAVQVVRIGDSGARAAWSDTHYVAPHHPHGSDE
jgi:hypothetical protein